MKQPWGGRFKESTDALMLRFSSSIFFDKRLYAYDIEGSIAHCKTLQKCKILKPAEAKKIITGLNKILKEFDSGKFKVKESLEDIHMNIEKRLIDLIGPVGGKLHTGRSRNDQVALDIRLYLRDEIEATQQGLAQLGKTILAQAKKHVNTLIPVTPICSGRSRYRWRITCCVPGNARTRPGPAGRRAQTYQHHASGIGSTGRDQFSDRPAPHRQAARFSGSDS